MSAQKTALVCLMVFAAFLANGLVELAGRARAVVLVSGDRVHVSVCMRAEAQESCTLSLDVEKGR